MLNVFQTWLNSMRGSRPSPSFRTRRRSRSRWSIAEVQALEQRVLLSASFPEFVDPNPAAGNGFGTQVLPLSTGNVVITSPGNNSVYLFNGSTGALISTLTSSTQGDFQLCNVQAVGNGNFVVVNPTWSSGFNFDVGAVTWGSGVTGVSGTISAANSLIGGQSDDLVGYGGVTVLPNGNYLVNSWTWSNANAFEAGAVTFGRGSTGVTGGITSANSLVGSHSQDMVGYSGTNQIFGNQGQLIGQSTYGITVLTDGNYVVSSPFWSNGFLSSQVGAITWGNKNFGTTGTISTLNSVVGTTSNDQLGSGGVFPISGGRYVVSSPNYSVGALAKVGAATWFAANTQTSGSVSALNSMLGTAAGDQLSSGGVTALANGNYVVNSPKWANGLVGSAGAVTWGNGLVGTNGVVTALNSLVGSTAGDLIGNDGIFALPNGNYVVDSSTWSNGATQYVGAVTLGNGVSGTFGAVGTANSLIGSTTNDRVGGVNPASGAPTVRGVVVLANGNFVVLSRDWNNGAATSAGAVTWVSAVSGLIGNVNAANSLVGSTKDDEVGLGGVSKLSGNNYLVLSPNWNKGAAAKAGAVTFSNSPSGIVGTISAANSLIGGTAGDRVGSGGFKLLSNGNYVISSPNWANGAASGAGAATWGSGSTGVKGAVTSVNSLVGTTAGDNISAGGLFALSNGNYVVDSFSWDNGAVANAGAVTWGNGATGTAGTVTTANSLVGSSINDLVGSSNSQTVAPVVPLANGNYVVLSPLWSNSGITKVGAVTLGKGTTGTSGAVSSANSLIGSTSNDEVGVGGVTALSNSNYVVSSPFWNNSGVTPNAGAMTLGSATTGISGAVGAINSVVGFQGHASQGTYDSLAIDNVNQNFLTSFPDNSSGRVVVSSQTFTPPPTVLTIVGLDPTALSYIENGAPLKVAPLINIFDPNSTTIKSATIQISANYQNGPDRLDFVNTAKIIGTFSANTGTLTLSGVDTIANYVKALESVTYRNLQDNISALTRTITIIVSDGSAVSAPVTRNILVTAVNDPPLLSNVDPSPLVYNAQSAPIAVAPTLLCADPDNDFLPSATIQITGNYQKVYDKLTFTNTNKISSQWDVNTGTLTLTGTDTVSNYRVALRAVMFSNSNVNPSTLNRTVTFTTTDGSLSSNSVTRSINVNLPPKLTNLEAQSLSYKRGTAGMSITQTLGVSGVDNSTLASAVIQITVNYSAGDQLIFADTANIKGAWNATTGTLTLTGFDTDVNYQAALRSVQFRNLSATASTFKRSVSFTVSDGSLPSNTLTRTINVT